MSSFEKKYNVTNRDGDTQLLTAKELFDRVLEDDKSIGSATEIVRVCNNPCFPERYAIGIKTFILRRFVCMESWREYPSRKNLDDEAGYSCYNSLPSTDETVKEVKDAYLKAVIYSITKYTPPEVRSHAYLGQTYREKIEEWKKAKFDEYVSAVEIDFERLKEDLFADFNRMVKSAEEEGAFDKDDEEYCEEMRRFLASRD